MAASKASTEFSWLGKPVSSDTSDDEYESAYKLRDFLKDLQTLVKQHGPSILEMDVCVEHMGARVPVVDVDVIRGKVVVTGGE